MLADASAKTGLYDFGPDGFLADYDNLIAGLNAECRLSKAGLMAVEDLVQRLLANRLRMQRDLRLHPDIEAQELAPPVIITGFPRTGSTKLQRMLSASPDFQPLTFWKMFNVAPFPDSPLGAGDPRIEAALEVEELAKLAFPEVWATHPTPALDADEDFLLHELTFAAPTIPMRLGAPRLMQQLTPVSRHVYEDLRTTLKYMQWQHEPAGTSPRPFVLKSPVHIGSLATLAEVFPGCKIIHCHRDIEVSIASTASMMDHAERIYSDVVDAPTVGAEVLAYWSGEWENNLAQRRALPAGTCLDVGFADINANAMAVLETIYAHIGLPVSDEARAGMLDWEAANNRHKHGTRSYRSEDYGLTGPEVRGACTAYLEAFEDLGLLGTRETAR
jgi:hypothetical protein